MQRSWSAVTGLLFLGLVGCTLRSPHARGNAHATLREMVLRYDAVREADLWGSWDLAEQLYGPLRQMPLPEELLYALQYQAALTAYDAGRWEDAASRCERALATKASTPWRASLYELWGLSAEHLGRRRAAYRAYAQADLPFTRARTRALAREERPAHESTGLSAPRR